MTTNLSEDRAVVLEVRSTAGGPLHPDQARLFVTTGRYNFALCDQSGAIIRTFIPETAELADVMAALGRFYEPMPGVGTYAVTLSGERP